MAMFDWVELDTPLDFQLSEHYEGPKCVWSGHPVTALIGCSEACKSQVSEQTWSDGVISILLCHELMLFSF
jgi:hypothetical protein